MVEVAGHHRPRAGGRQGDDRCLVRAVAVAKRHADGVVEVGNRDVLLAIAVEVADHDRAFRGTGCDTHRREERGYGAVAFWLLSKISAGGPWRELAAQPFGGAGSRGNGAAMRAAPIGAFFSHDLKAVIEQAAVSARVTHAHPDGQAGAIAVAVATAIASTPEPPTPRTFLEMIFDQTSVGPTRQGIARAILLLDVEPAEAARALGTGVDVLSSDTVPFALWVVAQHYRDFSAAMTCALSAVPSAESDMDILGAIVGGIVAMSASPSTIPETWRASCEALPLDCINKNN